ncbi:MAG: peptidoglycan editing factor PgeF [Cystobacterineae bacterium]|nr:peptidoglycan editing factor PgeF [Cystobacterineae bacterium]
MRWKGLLSGEAGWLSPAWEVPAGFCTALMAEGFGQKLSMAQSCERLSMLAGLKEAPWAVLKQVHGVEIKKAEGLKAGVLSCLGEGDGVWTEQPGVVVAVQTADCVPILMKDGRRRRVAAVHAGRRGVWGRIAWAQLEVWLKEGSALEDIEVVLGPCIGPCCYEVDEEMAASFAQRWGMEVLSQGKNTLKPTFHLAKALEVDLLGFGLLPSQVERSPLCTFCDSRFHSYRREQGKAGRQLSWVRCSF